jgi:hypothetical protein
MQKLINLLALASFGVSAAVVGGGAYLYLNKDTLIEDARTKVTKAVTEAVTEALPGMIDGAMPKMPEVTGPAMPTTTGPALPFGK